jgi:YVTN family beta-propeller protein
LDSDAYLEALGGGAQLSSRRHFAPAKMSRSSSLKGEALDAAGLFIDRAGAHVYVADRSSRSVLVYDTASGEVTDSVALDVPPSTMIPLLRPGTFLLNVRAGANDPVWVLDTNGRNTAYFVGMGSE